MLICNKMHFKNMKIMLQCENQENFMHFESPQTTCCHFNLLEVIQLLERKKLLQKRKKFSIFLAKSWKFLIPNFTRRFNHHRSFCESCFMKLLRLNKIREKYSKLFGQNLSIRSKNISSYFSLMNSLWNGTRKFTFY